MSGRLSNLQSTETDHGAVLLVVGLNNVLACEWLILELYINSTSGAISMSVKVVSSLSTTSLHSEKSVFSRASSVFPSTSTGVPRGVKFSTGVPRGVQASGFFSYASAILCAASTRAAHAQALSHESTWHTRRLSRLEWSSRWRWHLCSSKLPYHVQQWVFK